MCFIRLENNIHYNILMIRGCFDDMNNDCKCVCHYEEGITHFQACCGRSGQVYEKNKNVSENKNGNKHDSKKPPNNFGNFGSISGNVF